MDIALLFQSGGSYTDIHLAGPDLLTSHDLETAVIISLFSDAPAQAGDQVDGSYRGGWWGDAYNGVPSFKLGSRIWLLRRQKLTQSVANAAKQYALEALQWLVTDGIAASINVETFIVQQQFTLGLIVKIFKPQTTVPEIYQFQDVWSQF